MIVAVTGHTSGIGQALFNKFGNKGYSRSNGYSINDYNKIIQDAKDCDVFINNAYDSEYPWAQVELLYALWNIWQDKEKLIVNISSNSPDQTKKKPHNYAVHKSALDKASIQLTYLNKPCKIMNVRPGYCETPRVKHVQDVPKINTDELASFITLLFNYKSMYISEVTILPKTNANG